jgi:NAD(P)-dependent dehydrogenase (short-subunit alcohol dehydrogenase family)
MDLGLNGKVAIVTGGGRGIGRATVEVLAREGVQVAYCSRSLDQLRAVEKEVTGFGGTCLPVQIDLQDKSAGDDIVRQTLDQFGDLDILVCNHGFHQIKDWEDLTDEDWERTFDINFFGAMRVCRAALRPMVAKKKGHVVIVSAGSIYKPSIGPDEHPHYTAAKAAVSNMAKFLSKRYGPDNILVNAVLPAYGISQVGIDRWAKEAEERGVSFEEHFVQTATHIGLLPALQRPGTTEEFARIIAFLVSDANTYMSGVDVQIDGGGLDTP